ncbi:hypothetical protein PSAC2689_70224 [Paraburkholderia sacchari]
MHIRPHFNSLTGTNLALLPKDFGPNGR